MLPLPDPSSEPGVANPAPVRRDRRRRSLRRLARRHALVVGGRQAAEILCGYRRSWPTLNASFPVERVDWTPAQGGTVPGLYERILATDSAARCVNAVMWTTGAGPAPEW